MTGIFRARARHIVPRFNCNNRASRRFLALSSVEGPLDPPLVTKTLGDYFVQDILSKHSTRPALICKKEIANSHGGPRSRNLGSAKHLAWDFEEFDRHISALARGLLLMGVKVGDTVGVVMGNNRCVQASYSGPCGIVISMNPYSAYAMLQWACGSIGAILVTINPAYRAGELVRILAMVIS